MLIDPQHGGAPGLDFETWEGKNLPVARNHTREVGLWSVNRSERVTGNPEIAIQ
jgi:hypothetical protein